MWFARNAQVELIPLENPPKTIYFTFLATKFGQMIMGVTKQSTVGLKDQLAICVLYFVDKSVEKTYEEVQKRWPKSELLKDDVSIQLVAEKLVGDDKENSEAIPIAIVGTEFQLSVWQALVDLKSGETCTYSQLAERMGRPAAIRAVANAVAKNEVAILIPCHRIVSQNGASKYHWGAALKQQLLAFEKSSNY
ncbi:methylated-DNA--protein-cysteine methyltransferase, inducible [Drosophila subpulchrella]|uniref:methylated-DNA--protein-cysteine methyltransferase, inducible n=1 Tax=Drosophila subpulchrella TaxID=1486046 RepID=UPI0018A196A7|nr:methylated-DNA--protein-cysteine methyltransferase, inducible [Drosophila subpulchrella]